MIAFSAVALAATALAGISATAQVPTVWVIGDSTASNVDHRGWGDPAVAAFSRSSGMWRLFVAMVVPCF
jgi:hypothetical protein